MNGLLNFPYLSPTRYGINPVIAGGSLGVVVVDNLGYDMVTTGAQEFGATSNLHTYAFRVGNHPGSGRAYDNAN